jgi:hypothetical protein
MTVGWQLSKNSFQPKDNLQFLSPIMFTHPKLCDAREYALISEAIAALSAREWTNKAKCDALEMVLEVALVMRAAYTNDRTTQRRVTAGTLMGALCGSKHEQRLATGSSDVDAMHVPLGLPLSGCARNGRSIDRFKRFVTLQET